MAISSLADCQSPIGIFDSGLGGLSVYRHVRALLPHESFVYVADSAHAPYGAKSAEFIQQRSLSISQFLVDQGVKLIVVACNTATAAAVAMLRDRFSIPIVGMEPGIKPGALQTDTGKVGVLATSGTLASERFAQLHNRYGQDVEVLSAACEGWVEFVERGELQGERVNLAVSRYVKPLVADGADVLILGCTHYPFLEPMVRESAGRDVQLIDTGVAVAKRVQQLLERESSFAAGKPCDGSSDIIYSSARDEGLQDKIVRLLGGWTGRIADLPNPQGEV